MTPHIVTSGGWITIVPADNPAAARDWARARWYSGDVVAREATTEDLLLFDQLADSIRAVPQREAQT
jgi:hypothetical protein